MSMGSFVVEDVKWRWVPRCFEFMNKGCDCATYLETLAVFSLFDSNIVGIIIVADHKILVPFTGFDRDTPGYIGIGYTHGSR